MVYWCFIKRYEIRFGFNPFQSETIEDTKNNILNGNICFPKVKNETLEIKNFKKFIRKLLFKDIYFRNLLTVKKLKNEDWLKDIIFLKSHEPDLISNIYYNELNLKINNISNFKLNISDSIEI